MREVRDDLSSGEVRLLDEARRDDISFVWVLILLGIMSNPPPTPSWRPGPTEIDAAFCSLRRLGDRGLVEMGRIEYVDGGPPGRAAPVRHVAEPLDVVRARVEAEVASAGGPHDWEDSCWVVATDRARELDSGQG